MAVVAEGCGAVPQRGIGAIIGDGVVLTAGHVVVGADSIRLESERWTAPATIVAIDPQLDVAVLKLPEPSPPSPRFELADPRPGQNVSIGFAGGTAPVVPARVLQVQPARSADLYGEPPATVREILRLDAAVAQGHSGAPVVDRAGRMVGMVFARSTSAAGVGYAISAAELRRVAVGEGGPASAAMPCA